MCSRTRGPARGAVFGHVPGQEYRHVALLGPAHQLQAALPNLGNATGSGGRILGVESLDGVNNRQVGAALFQPGQGQVNVGLRNQKDPVAGKAQPFRPQLYLVGGFLPAEVRNRMAALRHKPGQLQQQGGLANSRFPGQQGHRAGDDAAAQYPGQLIRRQFNSPPVFRVKAGQLL